MSSQINLSQTTKISCSDYSSSVTATFHCSFHANVSMDLTIVGSNGTIHLHDLAIPFEEKTASFDFTCGAEFVDMHIGWSALPERICVESEVPQEAAMVREFAGIVKGVRDGGRSPEGRWPEISRKTQVVVDAVKESIDKGNKLVYLVVT